MDIKVGEIEKVFEVDDAVWYKTTCSCGLEQLSIWIEEDSDMKDTIVMTFNYDCGFYDNWCDNWFKRTWRKIKACWRIMVHGHYELEGSFIFRGEDQMVGLMQAMNQGIDRLKQRKTKSAVEISQ